MSPRAAASRREAGWIAGLALAPLLPFLGKAFSVDAPVFVAVARRIVAAPLDPFGFEMFWDETSLDTAVFNRNPPLLSYWLAPWLGLFGEREWVLHAAALVFPLAAALAMWGIARRLCPAAPAWAPAALLVTTPAFVVLGTTLLLDVPVLACTLVAVWAVVRGAEPDGARWQWLAGVAAAAAGLTKYVGFSALPLVAAGAVLLCPARGRALLRVALPPLVVWSGWAAFTAATYGAVHFLGSTDVVVQRSFALPLFGNQLTSLFVWYGGTLVFPVLAWGAVLVRAGRGLEIALVCAALSAAAVWWLLVPGEPARRTPIDLFQLVLAVVCGAGALHLTATLVRPRAWLRDPVDSFLALWIGGVAVFSLFVNWHVNAADALMAAPPALLLLFRDPETRPSVRQLVVWTALLVPLSLALTASDVEQRNVYRDTASRIAREIGDAPGARWFVGHWGFQHYLEREGFRPVVPPQYERRYGVSEIERGDWLASARNVSQLDVTRNLDRFTMQVVWRFPVASRWPLRATQPDAGAGFYSHQSGYGPMAWSWVPVEEIGLARITGLRR